MIQNPNLVFYACIAKGTTIVAEFNSKDADLGALAAKCLESTPPLHSIFSHTMRDRTYTFLIDENFVYFGIFDEKFEKSEGLSFLKSVKDSFNEIVETNSPKRLENLNSHCFQGEFNPVFHHLLASPTEMDSPHSPRASLKHNQSGVFDSPREKNIGFVPLLEDASKHLKKKKKKRSEDKENKVDMCDDSGQLSRDFSLSNNMFDGDLGQQKVNRIWKKQVVVVLAVDLIVCSILFGIWLWICRGFKCIDG